MACILEKLLTQSKMINVNARLKRMSRQILCVNYCRICCQNADRGIGCHFT